MRVLLCLLAAFIGAALPSHALAWGDVGHQLICQIAYKELTDSTRTKLDAIMQADTSANSLTTKTFAQACIRPDHPRTRAPEHFLNVSRDTKRIDTDPCSAAAPCVLSAIKADLATASDSSKTNAKRKLALAFLGHWVGDVHQPLHVSFEDDRGGNEINAKSLCASEDYGSKNLHAVWDVCLVEQPRGITKADLTNGPKISMIRTKADELRQSITDANRTEWNSSDPVVWADESFQISKKDSTKYCTEKDGACWYSATNEAWATGEAKRSVSASQAYIDANKDIVSQRLEKAGVRLSKLLEQALQ